MPICLNIRIVGIVSVYTLDVHKPEAYVVALDHSYAKKPMISNIGNTELKDCFSKRVIKSIVKTQKGSALLFYSNKEKRCSKCSFYKLEIRRLKYQVQL